MQNKHTNDADPAALQQRRRSLALAAETGNRRASRELDRVEAQLAELERRAQRRAAAQQERQRLAEHEEQQAAAAERERLHMAFENACHSRDTMLASIEETTDLLACKLRLLAQHALSLDTLDAARRSVPPAGLPPGQAALLAVTEYVTTQLRAAGLSVPVVGRPRTQLTDVEV
jgi:hypothetical protein